MLTIALIAMFIGSLVTLGAAAASVPAPQPDPAIVTADTL